VFEVVGAFGTGYSLGYPGITTSLTTRFRFPSKLFIIIVMIVGRNRVLVDSVDHAVQLDWKVMEGENEAVKAAVENDGVEHRVSTEDEEQDTVNVERRKLMSLMEVEESMPMQTSGSRSRKSSPQRTLNIQDE
jgi:hypothetical protein